MERVKKSQHCAYAKEGHLWYFFTKRIFTGRNDDGKEMPTSLSPFPPGLRPPPHFLAGGGVSIFLTPFFHVQVQLGGSTPLKNSGLRMGALLLQAPR